jgi:hypothetical protein
MLFIPPVMFPPVMLSPPIIVSFCAYALEIPVVSKNPVVDNAIVAPMIANALNTIKVAMFILDDMLNTVKTLRLYNYCLMVYYRNIHSNDIYLLSGISFGLIGTNSTLQLALTLNAYVFF